MLPDVQGALSALKIPVFRGAYRGVDAQQPPDTYLVWTRTLRPIWGEDDGHPYTKIRVFCHLVSRGSPEAMQAGVNAALLALGFALDTVVDDYDETADLYESLSEWSAVIAQQITEAPGAGLYGAAEEG